MVSGISPCTAHRYWNLAVYNRIRLRRASRLAVSVEKLTANASPQTKPLKHRGTEATEDFEGCEAAPEIASNHKETLTATTRFSPYFDFLCVASAPSVPLRFKGFRRESRKYKTAIIRIQMKHPILLFAL